MEKTYPRLWTLTGGVAMVVTDLHGDWPAYVRYRDHFFKLRDRGQADYLILTGDLIHAEEPENDRSVDIVYDIFTLRQQYGDAVIYLCGNHEMPHIYGISLAKGRRVYTPDFEQALTRHNRRAEVLALFNSLPFYLRTQAGVSLTHAGAPAIIAQANTAPKLFNWCHQTLLTAADAAMANEDLAELRVAYARLHDNIPYHLLAKHYLAVSGPDDPRYHDLLRGYIATTAAEFNQLLWPALFTRNEQEYGQNDYRIFLDALLQELSADFTPQHLLVAGHIKTRGGYQVIANQHLRLSSGPHASSDKARCFLLFDTAHPVKNPDILLRGLDTVFK